VMDASTGRFQYVLAGHPAPVLLSRGAPPVDVAGVGLPIGMIDEATFDDETLTIEPGDRLYFYTDGATEALDAAGEEFGHARLLDEIARWRDQPLRTGLEMISATVRAWCGDALKDDLSLLAVERR